MLIDTHCHLDDAQFVDDLDAVLRRMRAAGVEAAVTIGTGVASSRRAVALAGAHPELRAAVGIHPHDARTALLEPEAAALEALARDARVVAIGETGLDYYRDPAPPDLQRALFARHIALARSLRKPIAIHCRDAYGDCLAQLRTEWPPPVRGVMHCFSGSPEEARLALDLGLYLSFAGPVTFPSAHRLREVVRAAPADRLLLETDAPYLAPQPHRGKRNEPAWLLETARAVADARGESLEAVATAATANARGLFELS